MFEDFESGSYSPKWQVEGGAFGAAPARGRLPGQMKVGGYGGEYLVNSYFGKDASVGRLASAPFKIERKFLKCLAGGGDNPQNLYMSVIVDGAEVARFTGANSEFLEPRAADLSQYMGKTARLEIVDNFTGGWGHISIDDIVFTDTPPGCKFAEARYIIKNAKKYLLLPMNNSAERRRLYISSGKGVLFNANAYLDFENPTHIAFLETRGHEGCDLTISIPKKLGENPVFKTSSKPDLKNYPNEMLRPQYHFSAPQGWLNDPNGMVWWRGKWRLYYQANPVQVSDKDCDKSWGLAVSDDLMNWQHRPIAIPPLYTADGKTHAIWSGTGFADSKNISGLFGKGGGLVFAYTFTGKGDFVAYSADGDFPKTFETPITAAKGRDPCIFYHEPTKKWVVLRYEDVYSPEHKKDMRKFSFYTSADLKNWRRTQILDDFYECPYIVAMNANGDAREKKYIIFDASGECVVGDFDGEKFTPLGGRIPKFVFGDAYAGQIFNNAPNGRIVNISWLRQHCGDFLKADMPFAEMMTLPMDLRLSKTGGAYRIYASASPEIEKYFKPPLAEIKSPQTLAKGEVLPFKNLPSSFMLEGSFDVSAAKNLTMKFLGAVVISYDASANAYRFSRLPESERTLKTKNLSWPGIHFNVPQKLENGSLKFKMFIDRSSVEIFHDGKQVFALYIPFGDEPQNLDISGGGVKIESLKIRESKKVFSKKNLKDL